MTRPRNPNSSKKKAPDALRMAAAPSQSPASSPPANPPKSSAAAPETASSPYSKTRKSSVAPPDSASRREFNPANSIQLRDGASAPEHFSTQESAGVRISRRAADRIRAGHVWIYASDVESPPSSQNPPALVPVADNRGLLLGTALYSPASQIVLRMVSREALDHAAWIELLVQRLRAAIARRKPFLTPETDSCRLAFTEADQLPGLVADKYGPLVVLQLLARSLDSAAVRKACVRVFRDELSPETILERPDPRIRELEGLSTPAPAPLWAANPPHPLTRAVFHLNGLAFHFDANAGQKTGAFLDQRANYLAAAEWAVRLAATGRALDVCTYQGGFALHLARVCRQITGIDASRASLEVAEQNLATNRDQIMAEVDWIEADAFALLRDWSDSHEVFDVIVLDPPAFAKSKRAVEGALRGYKELNLRALKMLRPGGLLVTCSCSHHVGWADLEGAVASAAGDAHRRVRLLERRGAAVDHPVVLNIPETEYLKCLILEAE